MFHTVISGLNFVKFQNFSFEPEFASFERKLQNDNGWNLGILTHPIYDLRDFPGNGHSNYGYCRWKSYKGWIRKNLRIHLSYHLKVTIDHNLGLKWKFWNFSEFSLVITYKRSPPFRIGHHKNTIQRIRIKKHIKHLFDLLISL